MRFKYFFALTLISLLTFHLPATAAELDSLLPELKRGGLVIVFRHGATDASQQDVYPFKFEDMKAQRQLSEKGKETARAIGDAFRKLEVPIGEVKASRLNRAIETARLLSGKEAETFDELTDSGAGSAQSMANPTGQNTEIGQAIRNMINVAPSGRSNTIVVTHKTNIADAFAKEWNDPAEAEAAIFRPGVGGSPTLIGKIPAADWGETLR